MQAIICWSSKFFINISISWKKSSIIASIFDWTRVVKYQGNYQLKNSIRPWWNDWNSNKEKRWLDQISWLKSKWLDSKTYPLKMVAWWQKSQIYQLSKMIYIIKYIITWILLKHTKIWLYQINQMFIISKVKMLLQMVTTTPIQYWISNKKIHIN